MHLTSASAPTQTPANAPPNPPPADAPTTGTATDARSAAANATATARPLPPALTPNYYLEPELLAAEQELIFDRTWQLAGHVSRLATPGSYVTAAAGSQPVLVVRDKDGQLRAYRNVCRHRASRLLSGSGQCKGAIRCRYHGWTYRFDGSLIGVPEALTYGDRLDKSALSLHPVRVEEMCGLVFVNLDLDATPLDELLGDLPQRLERFQIPTLRRFGPWGDGPSGDGQPANWKVVVENYIEGYHIPIAHPGLMRMLDYKHYDVEVHDNYVWFNAPFRSKPSSNYAERVYAELIGPTAGLAPEDRRVFRYVFIYPNTTIDLYPDQIATWQILPHGLRRTFDVWASYRPAGTGPRTRLAQWLNHRFNALVLDEDVDLVDNVQKGLETRGYECGPLSHREAAVAWFAERIRGDLAPAL